MGKIRSLILAFGTGAVFLSFEIYWIRVFSFATKSKPYTFGLVLGVYLIGLALGALLARNIYLKSRYPAINIVGFLLASSTIICFLTIPLTVWFSTKIFYGYWYGLIFVFFSTLLSGGIFSLLVKVSHFKIERAGSGVSFLSALNIVGALTGSLFTGYYLLDKLPLKSAVTITTLLGLGLSLICFLSIKSKRLVMISLIIVTAAAVIISSPKLHHGMYRKLMYMTRHVVIPPFKKVIENRSGVICLSETGIVYGDGAYDGNLSTDLYPKENSEIELAYLTFLFKPEAKKILVVGLATGAWTKVIANGPEVESVTAIEINPGYLELIKESTEVSSLLSNEKVNIVIDDGRSWLEKNPNEKFDYIILNTTFHWRSGATNLLSLEFQKLIKSHLNKDGVMLINTTGSVEVVSTTIELFSNIASYRIYLAASDKPFSLDKDGFTRIMKNYEIDGKPVLDLSVKEEAEALEYYLKLHYLEDGERWLERSKDASVITDDNMITEFKP